ncbi:hypothetical protein [Erwinia sp. CGal63]|uniref:hypothetical protein n=1 Tax=Erwinia sp. CGal63 TaxID=2919889 RepID=UPI003008C680
MKSHIKTSSIFYFWATFDLFYIARFVWINISQRRIPLIDDILSFIDIFPQQGGYALILIVLSLLLNVSILFSAALLFIQRKNVHWLIYAQTPLRLLYALPSLSVLPWLFKTLTVKNSIIVICAIILSEILKVSTIYLANKNNADSN